MNNCIEIDSISNQIHAPLLISQFLLYINNRGDYRRQQHYHDTITINEKLSQYYHDSSFEENLRKQELILVPIAL